MTRREDQPQQVVAHIVVHRGLEIAGEGRLPLLEVLTELAVLPVEHLVAAEVIDGAMLGGRHQPGAGVVRDARRRPLFERRHERVLREVFGQPDVAHDAREAGDDLRRLDAPDRVDRPMGVGSRHGYRSHHLHLRVAMALWAQLLLLLLELFADLLVVLDGRTRSEVFELEERPQLDFPVFERHPLCPLDGLFL